MKVGGYILGEFGNLIAGDPRSRWVLWKMEDGRKKEGKGIRRKNRKIMKERERKREQKRIESENLLYKIPTVVVPHALLGNLLKSSEFSNFVFSLFSRHSRAIH